MESILVVDSDGSSREAFTEALTPLGYKVTCVPEGKQAILRFESERPCLVLVDAHLQGLDPYETISKIREFDRDVPLVFLSKEDLPAEVKGRALTMGALAAIKKDFTTHLMMKEIIEILKERLGDPKSGSRRGNILVVDDEAQTRNAISGFLSAKGYHVLTAATGEEAFLNIKAQRPQLVFCDIRMPGMDGLMVLRKILEFDSSVKVVMLSAIQDEDVVGEAFREGASDYLIKPCNLMRLDALVLSILPQ